MVYFNNEYQLLSHFEPSDVIIDIGAHIGSFAFATLVRGARQVICVEAHPGNIERLREHLSDYISTGYVTVHHRAVWRSDEHQDRVTISPYPKIDDTLINTGGARISTSDAGIHVTTIGLDDLIDDRYIRLLKIDCEGAEFPILLTSRRLAQVQEIVGEYHEHNDHTLEQLTEYLSKHGFSTDIKQHQQYADGVWIPLSSGYFRAIR